MNFFARRAHIQTTSPTLLGACRPMATQLTTHAIITLLTIGCGLILRPNSVGDMRPRAIGLTPNLPTGDELDQVQLKGGQVSFNRTGTSQTIS